jgi:hypothetical protein
MKDARRSYESDAKEIASYAQPAKSRFLTSDINKGRQSNRRLNNSHGIFAFRTLQGGMTSGLSSQSRPWFSLGLTDEELHDDQEVKDWLSEVEKLMYGFFAQTNFYGAVKTGYLELGMFGTEACIMLEHREKGAVCHQLTFGEYWLATGDDLEPNALYRQCPMTALQAVQMFGRDNVSSRIQSDYDCSRYENAHNFYHAIETNDDMIAGRLGFEGKPWRSVYWEEADSDKDHFAQQTGFYEQPFWAPRWDTTGGDVWGQGPGHDALPDLRELQLQAKRKAEATDLHVHPEKIASSKVKLKGQPKSVVSVASVDKVGELVSVPYSIPYQTIGVIREDVEACKEAVNQATYADLFMAITNMNGIQPRNIEEIAARNEEKLTQLGPVIESVNNEKLEVAINRAFGIMERGRMLPPAPEQLRGGAEIKPKFISILTQMQRLVGLGQIERTVGFVGSQAGVYPEAIDKIDFDEMIDEYADRAGMPVNLIRSTADAEKIRADRARQQNMQQALAAAPAVKDGADAVQTMAEVGQDALPLAGAMPL